MAEAGPIGIMPRKIWLEHRARDLSGAIQRYLDFICSGCDSGRTKDRLESVQKWNKELKAILDELLSLD